jgi:hypothetical protein
MSRVPLSERGVALALAIFALVVVGALVAAGFMAGVQEQRIAQATYDQQNALAVAEVAVADRVRDWPDDSGPDRTDIHKFGEQLFLIDVTGTAHRQATRRLGLLVRPGWSDCPPETDDSKCPIDRALHAATRLEPLQSRAWIELFGWP